MNLNKIKEYKYVITLILSTGCTALINFVVQIYVARNSTTEFFGIFSTYNTILLVILPLLTVGLGHFFIKIYSEKSICNNRIDINSLILILISTLLGLLVLNIFLNLYYQNVNFIIIFFLSTGAVGYAYHELIQSYLVGIQDKINLIIWQPYLHFVRLISIVFVVLIFKEINFNTLAIYSLIFSLFICFTIFILKNKLFNLQFMDLSKRKIKNTFKESFWFGMVGFLYILYSQINVLYVGKVLGDHIAGYFNIGYTFVLLSLILPNTIYYKILLPKLHYLAKNEIKKLIRIYRVGSLISLFLGSIVSLFLYVFSENIISLVYGDKFLAANIIFKNIILSIPLFYLSIHLGVFSYLGGNQKYKVLVLLSVTIFSLIINYVMVLYFGVMGSALSLCMVVFLMALLYVLLNHFIVFKNLVKGL